ncbi:MAG TPA: ATP-binding protein [Vicinamibacterales bacterium]|nr:ATP-binding protein [Vicinamibacterales bacterium]
MTTLRRVRSLFHVVLPVAVASILVFLAIVNVALVKSWKGEFEDGVLWQTEGSNVVAREVDRYGAGARAGIQRADVLLMIDRQEVSSAEGVQAILHQASGESRPRYVVQRQSEAVPLDLELQPMPLVRAGLYYSVAMVGILAIVVGASVRLRRPNDRATLHFFWLTVAFFGVMAFTPSGLYNRLDYFFDWADLIARLALPPLFLHFAFVFPERAEPWLRPGRQWLLVVIYIPAFVLGIARVLLMTGAVAKPGAVAGLEWIERLSLIYLAICLLGGLAVMVRALTRLRSVTARRQLRWIVWGSSLGALPFILLYLVPFLLGRVPRGAEYTAVLLGCIPLAFASAIVRYRLMDIEVIIKKVMVAAAAVIMLALMYVGLSWLLNRLQLPGADQTNSRFMALLATLLVALVAPWMWRAIQAGLDRLYYRDRYDYRRALLSFTRDLNSDLVLSRLSQRLVDRIAETLGIDRIALFLPDPKGESGQFLAYAAGGLSIETVRPIVSGSVLAVRLMDGQTVAVDDPVGARRLTGDEGSSWREAGLFSFVPCVSNGLTIAVIAVSRRAHGEPLSSEDMSLLTAVAGQAATAIENARLYSQLQDKANEIETVRQFNANVVESLTDALVVVDLQDRVLLWNRRAETLVGVDSAHAVGQPISDLFERPFHDAVVAARRDAPSGTTLFRVQLSAAADDRREALVNLAIAPLERDREQAGWILVIADVTDRATLEEQLRLSERMASIGLLAAGVAHEVNTPLTGISSFTQMLLDRSEPGDPRKELLEKIERQTFRAAKIVNNLLNLARPNTSEAQAVDVNVVIGDILSLLEHQLRTSRVQVRRDLTDQDVPVRGIEYKLQQVFLNLFLNARDAMPGGGWLSISTRVRGREVLVEVSDTGVGIPPEHLARIYDPFFTTKAEGRGTGLGLSVTYGIVQEHGGVLVCDSAPGEGTKFRLVLPLAAAEVPQPEAQPG